VNDAPVSVVDCVSKKSSAASRSVLPPASGREATAIRLVTLPVLNENGSAHAGAAERIETAATRPPERMNQVIRFLL
jgi:hypothetical protein